MLANQTPPSQPGGGGIHFPSWLALGRQEVEKAQTALAAAEQRLASARQTLRLLSDLYHPFDLFTGASRSPEQLRGGLSAGFDSLDQLAKDARLPETSLKALANCRKAAIEPMIETLSFFLAQCQSRLDQANLPAAVRDALLSGWLPGEYLRLAAAKGKPASRRRELRERSAELLAPLNHPDSPIASLAPDQRLACTTLVSESLALFQRSSSITEGFNSHLEIANHAQRSIPAQRLEASVVVHNYHEQRSGNWPTFPK
jgi:hypothetical protein